MRPSVKSVLYPATLLHQTVPPTQNALYPQADCLKEKKSRSFHVRVVNKQEKRKQHIFRHNFRWLGSHESFFKVNFFVLFLFTCVDVFILLIWSKFPMKKQGNY